MIKLQHHSSPPPSSFAPQRRSLSVSLSVTFSQITQTPPPAVRSASSLFPKAWFGAFIGLLGRLLAARADWSRLLG